MDHDLRPMTAEEASANLFENLGSTPFPLEPIESPPFSLESLESPSFLLESLESPSFPQEPINSSGRDSGLGMERRYSFDEENSSPPAATFPVSLNSIKKEVDPDESANLFADLHQEMETAPSLCLGSMEAGPVPDGIVVSINFVPPPRDIYRTIPQTNRPKRERKQRMENLVRTPGENSTAFGVPSAIQRELISSNSRKGKEKPLYLKTQAECTQDEWRKARRALNTKLFHERKNKKVRVAKEVLENFWHDHPHIFVGLKQKNPELYEECFSLFLSK